MTGDLQGIVGAQHPCETWGLTIGSSMVPSLTHPLTVRLTRWLKHTAVSRRAGGGWRLWPYWPSLVAALLLLTPTAWASELSRTFEGLRRAHQAVLAVQAKAVEGAPSIRTLGEEREGSGIVISADGLVLTIGYLVLEAESIDLVDEEGKRWPARVWAHDLASGLALLRPLAPLSRPHAPLGRPGDHPGTEPLMVVSGGPEGEVGTTALVLRQPFSGTWEYHIEGALYTSPPRPEHSGAGLFNARGELLGVGSLVLSSLPSPAASRRSGNLFVPVDLIASQLDELRRRGPQALPARAWLGINCAETARGLRITRISDDSPADAAGLLAGDGIERIDGIAVTDLASLWKTLWQSGPAERAVVLDIVRDGQRQTVTVHSIDRRQAFKRAQGV